MRKMKIAMLQVLLAIVCISLSGCANRYYTNYSGQRYPKTDSCELVDAVLQFYRNDIPPKEQLAMYKTQGYEIIGMGPNDVVTKCSGDAISTGFVAKNTPIVSSYSSSTCEGVKMSKKNQKRLKKACRAVGANIAIFDSQNIWYLRENQ